ncbi:MAG: N-acetyltransferase, partial [Fusobacterium sp. JB021]|nr:N-acetyltransferase [Fusobacterium sp. JB021]
MNIVIRHEEEKDFYKVEELARESFYNLYFPGCEEHLVINKMRNHRDYIKNLSYILEIDGKIIGGIFYTKSRIIGKDNKIVETISFGPVFIKPGYQRQGFGKKLIEYSIKEAKKEGYRAILTLG